MSRHFLRTALLPALQRLALTAAFAAGGRRAAAPPALARPRRTPDVHRAVRPTLDRAPDATERRHVA